jgi:hypothetical protein
MTTKKQLEKQIDINENKISDIKARINNTSILLASDKIPEEQKILIQLELNADQSLLAATEQELKKLRLDLEERYLTQQIKTEQNVVKALNDFNAYYISSERQWYCIYSEHNRRHQPKVAVVDSITMRDMIYGATKWQTDNDWDLKKIAHDNNRYYRDVERTFLPNSPNTLNQMTELRKFWLKPIHDQQPHIAFDLLFLNLVGGDQAYKDQIEKYIAYSYVKPEDIFAPNIDSSARGGVGRDTVFRILEIIFTEECCGEAKKETVQGTHNGELWGKVWVKISESNNRLMDINELKNLTGGHNFRLRRMGENAVQVPRTFRFMMMSNNYEGTARLTGSGSDAEDRRWEPIFSQTSLLQRIADHLQVELSDSKVGETLQDWQQSVFQNEVEIAKWLGYIINKHKPETIAKLKPLHGDYYNQMVERQKNSMSIFMENIISLQQNTNCYDIDIMYKIFKIVNATNMTKNQFAKRMCEWLMAYFPGVEFDIKLRNIYRPSTDNNGLFVEESRVKRQVVSIKDQVKGPGRPKTDEDDQRLVFDITDFVEQDKLDDKGKELGLRPHPNNIREELF